MNENVANDPTGRSEGLSRRTIVKGAAWSVPVIATTVAMPMASASVNCQTVTHTVASPDPTTPEGTTETFIVPAGVTSIRFSVAGGGGGAAIDKADSWEHASHGGSGALVTGELPVTPGQPLTLIVGQGGAGGTFGEGAAALSGQPATGGKGYGDGGTSPAAVATASNGLRGGGGGGGGGSAILLGDTPLVVAGGGGGVGSGWRASSTAYLWSAESGGDGGDADAVAAPKLMTLNGAYKYVIPSGGGASGAVPGAAGELPTRTPAAPLTAHPGVAATGRDGADGTETYLLTNAGQVFCAVSSGGGGGGYAGGGTAGGLAQSLTTGGNLLTIGGTGGGGSSYVAPVVQEAVTTLAGNGAPDKSLDRYPGAITLTYEVCP